MAITEKIPQPLVGQRLDRVVAFIASCTRSQAVELIEGGNVVLSGKPATSKSIKVQENQEITIDEAAIQIENEVLPDEAIEFSVLFEDHDILVIDKPAGLVVHPGSGNEDGTLVNGLMYRYPEIADVGQSGRPGVVHRLDKDTSGVMVVARSQEAYEVLIDMMASHDIERDYLALVHGIIENEKGVVEAPIGRSHRNVTQMAVSSSGKDATTNYRVLRRFNSPMRTTLVELSLETGRTHQIRVHMRAINHPVIGDKLYFRHNSLGLGRPFLHSERIYFEHPISGEICEFRSELPEDLRAYLSKFKAEE